MRPKRKQNADYERLLAQERLILDATEAVVALLDEQGVSRQELAARLGKSKGFVSQILTGERNMTLRTLANFGYALGRDFSVVSTYAAPPAVIEPRQLLDTEYERPTPEVCRSNSQWSNVALLRAAEETSADAHEYALAA